MNSRNKQRFVFILIFLHLLCVFVERIKSGGDMGHGRCVYYFWGCLNSICITQINVSVIIFCFYIIDVISHISRIHSRNILSKCRNESTYTQCTFECGNPTEGLIRKRTYICIFIIFHNDKNNNNN